MIFVAIIKLITNHYIYHTMNFEQSFLDSIQFNKNSDTTVGGYTYPIKKPLYDKNDITEGGGNNSTLQVPIGLVVNKHDDNMTKTKGTYTGVIDMQKINEFIDLNYRVLKQITRKNRPNHNITAKKR